MVLGRKKEACPLRVDGEPLPQVEEIKCLGVFPSEEKIEPENDRWIGAASAVMQSLYRSVVVKNEVSRKPKGEALDLPVELRFYPHLRS